MLEDLTQYHFPHLRWCVGAGEPLNPEVIDVWREATGLTIRDGYGQTETVLLVGNFPPLAVKPGSMGKPSPGFDVAVIDDAGQRCAPGQGGRYRRARAPAAPGGPVPGVLAQPGGHRRPPCAATGTSPATAR